MYIEKVANYFVKSLSFKRIMSRPKLLKESFVI